MCVRVMCVSKDKVVAHSQSDKKELVLDLCNIICSKWLRFNELGGRIGVLELRSSCQRQN